MNREQRRAAARAAGHRPGRPGQRQTTGVRPDLEQITRTAACPDCDSDVSVAELVPGVFGADVRHDDSCPRMIAADRGNTP